MKQITRERIKYCVADCISVAAGWFVFNVLRFFTVPTGYTPGTLGDFLSDRVVLAGQFVVPLAMVALYALSGSYNRSNTLYKSRLDELVSTFVVSFVGMLGIFFTALINDNIPERLTNYELMLILLLCLFTPVAAVRMVIISRNAVRIRRGLYALDTLVVGATADQADKLRRIIDSEVHSGLRVTACADPDGKTDADTLCGLPVYHSADIGSLSNSLGVQALIVMPSPLGLTRTAEIINSLYALDCPLFITPDLHSLMAGRPKVSQVTAEPLVDINNANISPASVNFKRLGDVIVSAAALLILAPVYAIIAMAVKSDSPGPVFYRQVRIGYHKKPFKINKFRTMKVDAEPDGPALASGDDPRVTRVGRVLRKYRLDELPQFWNVLKGEMSLVGPRPEREYYIDRIVRRYPSYSLIHQVRPGITSWGMVKYGYAANVDQMIERLPYDLLYIENVSLGVDLKILFHTVNTVLRGRGQ
ncbi:MAG: sugar transferase [Muribaculaceae bacterium]|nr:sugar transferase [Muribaculaceae bacterium]